MIKSNRIFYFLVILITVVSIGIRYYYAATQELWIDEVLVLQIAHENDWKQTALVEHWDKSHPPLLHLYTKVLLKFISYDDKIALRFLSFFLGGLATIPLMRYIKVTHKSATAAILGGILFAINPTITANSFSLRPYGVIIFLFLIFLASTRNLDLHSDVKKYQKMILINIIIIFSFFWDYSSIWFLLPFAVITVNSHCCKVYPFVYTQNRLV